MKHSFDLTQNSIDEYATKVEQLDDWLAETSEDSPIERSRTIPVHLTTLSALVVASVPPIFFDMDGPMAMCWGNGCIKH